MSGPVVVADSESDEALVLRAGRGDRLAASALIVRHADRIMRVSWRMLGERAAAEDATQETFLKLWRAADRWKPAGARFETWLVRIAMNVCLDQLRKRGREVGEDDFPEPADASPGAEAQLMALQRRQSVNAAVAALPQRQRQAIILSVYEEMSNPETAAALEVSVEAVESLLARARRSLKAALAPEFAANGLADNGRAAKMKGAAT